MEDTKKSTCWQELEKDFLKEFRPVFRHQCDSEWLHTVAVLLDKAMDDNIEFEDVRERVLSAGKDECYRQLAELGIDGGEDLREDDQLTPFAVTRAAISQAAFFWWFYSYGRNRVTADIRSRN